MNFDVPGIEFYDAASGPTMKYVYPDTAQWAAGWILSNTNDGAWLTLRKATENDVSRITKASGFRQDGPAQTSQKQSSAAVPASDVKP